MASMSSDTLTLDLLIRMGGFQQGLDKAVRSSQKSMNQIVRQADSATSSIASAFDSVGASISTYARAFGDARPLTGWDPGLGRSIVGKGGITGPYDDNGVLLGSAADPAATLALGSKTVEDLSGAAADAGKPSPLFSGMKSAWDEYSDISANVTKQTKAAFTSLFDSLTDKAVDWAFGADVTFQDVAASFSRMLAKMAMQAAASAVFSSLFSAVGSFFSPAAGAAGAASGAFDYGLGNASAGMTYGGGSFWTGGYTGNGGKYAPAGTVHGGEFVMRKEVVDQPGMRAYLERLNSSGQGLDNASAASPALASATPGTPGSAGINVGITINSNGASQVESDNTGLQGFGEDIGRFVEARYKQLEARSLAPQGNIRRAINGRM